MPPLRGLKVLRCSTKLFAASPHYQQRIIVAHPAALRSEFTSLFRREVRVVDALFRSEHCIRNVVPTEASQKKTRPMRRTMRTFLLILLIAAAVHMTPMAQTANGSAEAGSAEQAVSAPLSRLIHALAGSWSLQISYPKEPLSERAAGSGTEFWHVGPGGNSLVEEYHSTGKEGEIIGLGIFWWDKKADSFQVIWCDSTDSAGCSAMKYGARWERDTVVIRHERQDGGRRFLLREVFSDFTDRSFTQTLYQSEPGTTPAEIVTIHATRDDAIHKSTGVRENLRPQDLRTINVSADRGGLACSRFPDMNGNRLQRIAPNHRCVSGLNFVLSDLFQGAIREARF